MTDLLSSGPVPSPSKQDLNKYTKYCIPMKFLREGAEAG